MSDAGSCRRGGGVQKVRHLLAGGHHLDEKAYENRSKSSESAAVDNGVSLRQAARAAASGRAWRGRTSAGAAPSAHHRKKGLNLLSYLVSGVVTTRHER